MRWRLLFQRAACAAFLSAALSAAAAMSGAAAAPLPAFVRFAEDSIEVHRLQAARQPDSALVLLRARQGEARRTGDTRLLARSLRLEGEYLILTSRPPQSLPLLNEALALAEAMSDTATIVRCLRWRAVGLNYLTRFDEALLDAERIIVLSSAIGDLEYAGWGFTLRGWRRTLTGHFDPALSDLRRALGLFQRSRVEAAQTYAVNLIGNAQMASGDYAGAQRTYERALEVARSQSFGLVEVYATMNLGLLEDYVGDPARAAELFRWAYDAHLRQSRTDDAVGALYNLIRMEVQLGNNSEALRLADEGLAICGPHGLAVRVAPLLSLKASAWARMGRPEQAMRTWERLISMGDSAHVDARSIAAVELASSHAASGHAERAIEVLERDAVPLMPQLSATNRMRIAACHALTWLALGRPDRARSVAATEIAAHPEGAGGLERISLLTALCRAERALGRMDDGRRTIELAARRWEDERARSADPKWRETLGEMGPRVASQMIAIDAVHPAQASAPERILRAYTTGLRFKTRTLLERRIGPAAAARGAIASTFTASDVRVLRERLGPRELLLEWFAGRDTSWLFAVTREEIRMVSAPGMDALYQRLLLTHEVLAKRPRDRASVNTARAVSERLGTTLLASVSDMIERAEIVIVAPDGPLHLVPFAALPVRAGAPPLGAGRQVLLAPSGALLADSRASRRGPGPKPADDPAPGEERGRGENVSAPAEFLAYAGGLQTPSGFMRGALQEVKDIGRRYRSVRVRTSLDDSAQLTLMDVTGPRVMHFAGHTTVSHERPWRSGITVMEDRADRPAERLTADSLAGVVMSADLVVLASCASASGRLRSGEGVTGLASAFVAAGARTVVATLWPVDDDVTRKIFEIFYGKLERGATVSEALASVQREVREAPGTAHPFYWAGFVLIGQGDTLVPLTPLSPYGRATIPYLIGATVLGLILLVLYGRRRKRRWTPV